MKKLGSEQSFLQWSNVCWFWKILMWSFESMVQTSLGVAQIMKDRCKCYINLQPASACSYWMFFQYESQCTICAMFYSRKEDGLCVETAIFIICKYVIITHFLRDHVNENGISFYMWLAPKTKLKSKLWFHFKRFFECIERMTF